MCPDKRAPHVTCNAPLPFSVHVVWMSLTVQRSRYLVDHGNTLLGLLLAGSAELETGDIEGEEEMEVSQYGFTSLKIVTFGELILYTPSTSNPKERVPVLKKGMLSVLTSSRTCSDTDFEVSLKRGKVWKCFSKLVLYFFDGPEAEGTSFI